MKRTNTVPRIKPLVGSSPIFRTKIKSVATNVAALFCFSGTHFSTHFGKNLDFFKNPVDITTVK